MNCRNFLILFFFVSTSAFGQVSAYFNQNERESYTDPYRNIHRAGDNLESVLLKEIKKAQKSIYLAVQELRLPLIAKALIEKYQEGVDVRVVLENNYNFTILSQAEPDEENEHDASRLKELSAFIDLDGDGSFSQKELETRDAIYMLRKAKVPVIDDTFDSSKGSGLMHHKFMVVDGKSTIISTANFTMSCIHGDILAPSSRGNPNSMVHVVSPSFARIFIDEFAQLWGNGIRGNFGQNKTFRGPMKTTVKGVGITVQFSPTSRRYNWEESVNGLIAAHVSTATHSIKAALFVFSDQNIADAMNRRRESGVEVGVIIEPKFAFREYSELLDLMGLQMRSPKCVYEPDNRPWLRPTREAGMAKLPQGDVLHHKFAVIDRYKVVVGSQNWSDAANHVNDETLIVIEDRVIADQFYREYERVKRNSELGPPSWLIQRIQTRERECADIGTY